MIKKTLRNVAVGTIAAGAMILPAATTVAPSMQLMACEYEDSRDTNTKQTLSDYVISGGSVTSTVTVKSLDGGTPNGTVTVTVMGPGPDRVKSKRLSGSDTTVSFKFGGFGKRSEGTYRFVAVFEGDCRYANSRDTDRLVVTRG